MKTKPKRKGGIFGISASGGKIKKPAKTKLVVDPQNPNFGALLEALRRQHSALPLDARKRWMQAIIAAASHPALVGAASSRTD